MYPLVESLKLKDGFIQNPEYHNQRLNRSKAELFPGSPEVELGTLITIPEEYQHGIFKIRVLYDQFVREIEFSPYQYRSIQSLKVVHHESVDYHIKYTDRQILQQLFDQRGDCDDIIIVKNDFVGDSYSANLLFFEGKNWYTPTTPLLKGTKRQFLLDQGVISEKEIREKDIRIYQKVGLINALIDFDEMPIVPVKMIF
jgi:4-amino-4-deoxychorismate lyase